MPASHQSTTRPASRTWQHATQLGATAPGLPIALRFPLTREPYTRAVVPPLQDPIGRRNNQNRLPVGFTRWASQGGFDYTGKRWEGESRGGK